MIATERRRLGALVVAAGLAGATACGSNGGGGGGGQGADGVHPELGPRSTAAAPPATFHATVTPTKTAVEVSYTLTNRSDGPLYVVNRVPVAAGAGVRYRSSHAFATAGRGDRVVLSQALFDQPGESCSMAWSAPHPIGVTKVAPGASTTARVAVSLPLRFDHPYGDEFCDGPEQLPAEPAGVEFCLGVIADDPDLEKQVGDSSPLLVTHEAHWPQHLFCSDDVDL